MGHDLSIGKQINELSNELLEKYSNCILYKITIYDGLMDYIHTNGYNINELYIPSLNASFNLCNDTVNIIIDSKDRYTKENSVILKKLELPSDLIDKLEKLYTDYKNINKLKKELSSELSGELSSIEFINK